MPRGSRIIALLSILGVLHGCASMVETRSVTAGSPERVILNEKREPIRDQRDVVVTVQGNAVIAQVTETLACVKHLGDSRLTTVTVDRHADPGVLAFEAVATGVGATLVILGATLNNPCTGREFCINYGPLVAGVGAVIVVPSGLATLVDALAGGKASETHTETTEVPQVDRTPCKSGPLASVRVTLVLDDGTTHEAITGSDGLARIELDEAVWSAANGPIGADLQLGGKLLRRVKLERGKP